MAIYSVARTAQEFATLAEAESFASDWATRTRDTIGIYTKLKHTVLTVGTDTVAYTSD